MKISNLKKSLNLKESFSIWKEVSSLIFSNPKIIIPFFVLAIIEIIALWVLACSPHFPFNYVLAPPIRSIWGQIWLHYPYIYELLPRIFYYAKIVIGAFFGSMTSGVAILAIAHALKGEEIDFKKILRVVLKRYISLFILAVVLFTSIHFIMKQPQIIFLNFFRGHAKLLFLGPKVWFGIFLPVLTFFIAIILQGLFVYSMPFVAIRGKKFIPALFFGFGLFFKKLFKTLTVVMIPMLLYIPITILRGNMGFLAEKFAPEVSTVVLFLGILVGTLVVDCLMTVAITLIFLEETDEN